MIIKHLIENLKDLADDTGEDTLAYVQQADGKIVSVTSVYTEHNWETNTDKIIISTGDR